MITIESHDRKPVGAYPEHCSAVTVTSVHVAADDEVITAVECHNTMLQWL